MAISPDEVRNKTFEIVRKGYDQPEVHRYLSNIADELQAFNHAAATSSSLVDDEEAIALDKTVEPEPAAVEPEVPEESDDGPGAHDFDRVGNEISLMLRQAQESSIKIRQDAEVEARTLVDQVRLDIESDRLAHEQAAAELIARTEERAGAVRAEAEEYSEQTRSGADAYADERRTAAEQEVAEAEAAADSDRKMAAEKLSAATEEAEATIGEAQRRAEEIIANAESDAQARRDQLLQEARQTLATLIDAEKSSRDNLEEARRNIQLALDQLRLTDIDSSTISNSSDSDPSTT